MGFDHYTLAACTEYALQEEAVHEKIDVVLCTDVYLLQESQPKKRNLWKEVKERDLRSFYYLSFL